MLALVHISFLSIIPCIQNNVSAISDARATPFKTTLVILKSSQISVHSSLSEGVE